MILQFCGLSGSGKTTLAYAVKTILEERGVKCEVLDGDVYRKVLFAGLGFSKADRNENIRRLAFLANVFAGHGIVAIISAINPYNHVRQEIAEAYPNVKTVYVSCNLLVLQQRDTKQLYRKAMLPDGHPDKIDNLTGVNDPFEEPANPHLTIYTDAENEAASVQKLLAFILSGK